MHAWFVSYKQNISKMEDWHTIKPFVSDVVCKIECGAVFSSEVIFIFMFLCFSFFKPKAHALPLSLWFALDRDGWAATWCLVRRIISQVSFLIKRAMKVPSCYVVDLALGLIIHDLLFWEIARTHLIFFGNFYFCLLICFICHYVLLFYTSCILNEIVFKHFIFEHTLYHNACIYSDKLFSYWTD